MPYMFSQFLSPSYRAHLGPHHPPGLPINSGLVAPIGISSLGDYEFLTKIGEGTFGMVWFCSC